MKKQIINLEKVLPLLPIVILLNLLISMSLIFYHYQKVSNIIIQKLRNKIRTRLQNLLGSQANIGNKTAIFLERNYLWKGFVEKYQIEAKTYSTLQNS